MIRPVSINPGSHTDDGGLLDMSMEEVVARFLEREKRRHREAKNDENEQEIAIGVRSVPTGLIAILDVASHRMEISRSILTRCLSHQVALWYDSIPPIRDLTVAFYDAYQGALDNGFPDLCKRVKSTPYELDSMSVEYTSLRSITWVRNKLYDLSLPVGVSVYHLFLIGLCKSVSTTESGLYTKTIGTLKGEVDRFLTYVGQRLVEVQNLGRLVDYRIAQQKEK